MPSLHHVSYVPGTIQPPHDHPESSITIILGGSLTERVGSRTEMAGPLSVVVKPAGIRHANTLGSEGASTVQVELSGLVATDRPEGILGPWRWLHAGTAARRMLGVLREWRAGASGREEVERAVCDCIAALETPRETDPPHWLGRVAEELDDTAAAPAPVSDLATRAGLHPVALARLFRRHFGTSITERIRRRRVERAAGLLAGGSHNLAEIALSTGFADQSHLTRIFRRETGITPGAYRRLARSA